LCDGYGTDLAEHQHAADESQPVRSL